MLLESLTPTRPAAPLAASLLDTEARFLAENDTHIVLAIRLPKTTLRNNRALLTAAAEIAHGPPAAHAPPRVERSLAWRVLALAVSPASLLVNWAVTLPFLARSL